MKAELNEAYKKLTAELARLDGERERVTALIAAHDAFSGKAPASMKTAPMKKRAGRPVGSKNRPKVNGAVPVIEFAGPIAGEI